MQRVCQQVPARRVVWVVCLLLAGAGARAETYSLAGGLSAPPYVDAETRSGVILDIVRAGLQASGHQLGEVRFVSNLRAEKDLLSGNVDMALHIPRGAPGVYHSQPLVYYWNVAISLQDRNLRIRELKDLHDLRVMGFQNARVLLGSGYREAVDRAAVYSEQPLQRGQVVALYRGGVDAVVMDLHIFRHYRRQLGDRELLDIRAPYRVHSILPPTPRSVAFRDPRLRDEFDAALQALRESGQYGEILRGYIFWVR